ncbi:MAG TPA: CmpA/NrtA family ABC transporter substrate-binding protein, partial [Caulobacteraceae bacterium]|nr:CmpA/NrtA family ABC transporter substrate-binding protein [Caulobacteraceae bacterium]
MTAEKPNLKLGFIALTDCAPLIVAQEKGFFVDEGLDVVLSREASWANVRDRLSAGLIDGAHMLGPMAVAQSLGLGGGGPAVSVPLALSMNGSAITISKPLAEALRILDAFGMAGRPRTAHGLKLLVDRRRAKGQPPLTFAVVFPYSIHNYQLRYWLAAGGVNPDRDVRLVVTPPTRLVERMAAGEIDGFCVTAPWNSL